MSKTAKVIVGVIVGLCVLLLCLTVFVKNYKLDEYKDKNGWIHNDDTIIQYESDINAEREYALVLMKKKRLTNIDSHYYIETITPILNGYSGKRYTTIVFEDGTGIYYAGSDSNYPAIYGDINENGVITQEFGIITINGTNVIYTESSKIQSEETKNMYLYLPDKYKSDGSSVIVDDGVLYINIGVYNYADYETVYTAAKEVLTAYSMADLSVYKEVMIVVNNEYIFYVIDDTLLPL